MSSDWKPAEKKEARTLFDKAIAAAERECIELVRGYSLEGLEDVWKLEKEIREWRKELGELFQYSCSRLDLNFCIYLRKGWLKWEDISVFSQERQDWMRQVMRLDENPL